MPDASRQIHGAGASATSGAAGRPFGSLNRGYQRVGGERLGFFSGKCEGSVGGINSLWPLFGISNQCWRCRPMWDYDHLRGETRYALVTLLHSLLVSVTFTAACKRFSIQPAASVPGTCSKPRVSTTHESSRLFNVARCRRHRFYW